MWVQVLFPSPIIQGYEKDHYSELIKSQDCDAIIWTIWIEVVKKKSDDICGPCGERLVSNTSMDKYARVTFLVQESLAGTSKDA